MTHRCTPREWRWLRSCIENSDRADLAARFDEHHPERFTSFREDRTGITFIPPYAEDFSNAN